MIRFLFSAWCAWQCLPGVVASPIVALAQEITVRPQAQPGPLDNPLKGWCPYTNAGKIAQPYSMVFQYVSWRELEPVENDFRFADWEKSWDVEAARGRHIIFRVYIDYPKKESGLRAASASGLDIAF